MCVCVCACSRCSCSLCEFELKGWKMMSTYCPLFPLNFYILIAQDSYLTEPGCIVCCTCLQKDRKTYLDQHQQINYGLIIQLNNKKITIKTD